MSIVRSTRSKTRKRGGRRELSAGWVVDSPRGARDQRMVCSSPGSLDVRCLRHLPGRIGPTSTSFGSGCYGAKGEGLRAVCAATHHREGGRPRGQAASIESGRWRGLAVPRSDRLRRVKPARTRLVRAIGPGRLTTEGEYSLMRRPSVRWFASVAATLLLTSCAEQSTGPSPLDAGGESTLAPPVPTSTPESPAPAPSTVFPPVTPEGPIVTAPPE